MLQQMLRINLSAVQWQLALCAQHRAARLHSSTLCLNTVRNLSTQKHTDSEKNISVKSTEDKEKPSEIQEVSDWIKEIQKFDDRPPIKYRRQNYPDPISRATGILVDDVKIFFRNIYNIFYQLGRIISGQKPQNEESKQIAVENEKVRANITKSTGVDNTAISGAADESTESSLALVNKPVQERAVREPNATNKKQSTISSLMSQLSLKGKEEIWPGHCDVLIVGGGAVGSSIAYHLTKSASDGLRVVVLEKDPTYQTSSTVLSVGGIRQQFSLPENILLSLYGMQFMHDMPRLLEVDGDPPPCINFQPHGYLTLASELGLNQLKQNLYVQKHFNARVNLLEPSQLRATFPWMSTDGVAAGVLGLENEGWFDPWSLLVALRRKAIHLGAEYVHGQLKAVEFAEMSRDTFTDGHPSNFEKKIRSVEVELPDGEKRTINTAALVLATGHSTGSICYDMMGIGKAKEGLMAYPVPIEPRKRYVYCFHAPSGPGLATPLVIDPSGAYFRREGFGNMFLGGMSPPEDEEPPCLDLEVDHDYFQEKVWPILAHRVPAFQQLKVQGSWAGFYEYNVFDQNGIVGKHPCIGNMLLAAGFSGHGIQHSLGIGRAITELVMTGDYKTIDLARLQLERLHLNEPMYESGII